MLPRPSRLTLGLTGALIVSLAAGYGVYRVQSNRLQDTRAELAITKANVSTLQAALDEQNAAIDRLDAASQRQLDAAIRAIEDAPRPRQRVLDAMSSPAVGDTEAARVEDIDRRFLESLQ